MVLDHEGTITDRVVPGIGLPCPFLEQGSEVRVQVPDLSLEDARRMVVAGAVHAMNARSDDEGLSPSALVWGPPVINPSVSNDLLSQPDVPEYVLSGSSGEQTSGGGTGQFRRHCADSFPHWGVKTPPPDSDEDSELSPAELREAIMESTDMDMIDYSGEDALEILFSDPFFEVLRTTRYTSLVLFSGGVHGVFFTSEVAVARAHHGTMPGLNPLETDVVHGRRALHGSVDSLDKGEESTSSEPTDRHTSPPLTGITPEREERRPGSPRRSGEQASPSIGLGVQAGSLSIKNGEQTLSPTLLVDGFELNPDDDIDEEAAFGHWSAQHDKYEAAMAHNLADSSSGVESSASEAWQVTEARYGPADWRTLEARYGPRYLESATGMRLGDPNPRHPANHDSPLPLWHPRSSRRRNGEQTGEHGLGAHPGERGLTLLGEADGTPSAQPKHPRRSHGPRCDVWGEWAHAPWGARS